MLRNLPVKHISLDFGSAILIQTKRRWTSLQSMTFCTAGLAWCGVGCLKHTFLGNTVSTGLTLRHCAAQHNVWHRHNATLPLQQGTANQLSDINLSDLM